MPLWALLSHSRPCAPQGFPSSHLHPSCPLLRLYLSLRDLNLQDPEFSSQALPRLGAAPEEPAWGSVEVVSMAAPPAGSEPQGTRQGVCREDGQVAGCRQRGEYDEGVGRKLAERYLPDEVTF